MQEDPYYEMNFLESVFSFVFGAAARLRTLLGVQSSSLFTPACRPLIPGPRSRSRRLCALCCAFLSQGDGDPNESFEERRWKMVGDMIQRRGGVVTAEQLAPLLEPPKCAAAPRLRSVLHPLPVWIAPGLAPSAKSQRNCRGTHLTSAELDAFAPSLCAQVRPERGRARGVG